MSSSKDPLGLDGLDPALIDAQIEAKKKKPVNELEMQKEVRLAEKEKRLNTQKGKPPPAPPPPVEAVIDKSVLLDKIFAYRERFPNLKKRNTVTAKSAVEEVADELHFIELQLGSQPGGAQMSSTTLYLGMYGLGKFTESYWNPLGLDLTGLGNVTKQNMVEFQPILDELSIKHNAGTYTSAEWRLALAIGATCLTVNAANSNPEMARAVKEMNAKVNAPKGSEGL